MYYVKQVLTITALFLLAACGGGGGSGSGTTLSGVQSASDTATVTLTVVLQGVSASTVKGIQGTITLPSGVVLRTDAAGNMAGGVMTTTGTAAGLIEGKYTAATGAAPATVTIGFVTSGNLAAGDIVTLSANLSPGVSAPAVSAYTISGIKLVDAGGNNVSGASLALR